MFIYNDKLRIINNIYWNRYDLGCYEFSKEEVVFSYDNFGRLISCRLNCGKESFVLGKRALPYIRNWYNKKSWNFSGFYFILGIDLPKYISSQTAGSLIVSITLSFPNFSIWAIPSKRK